MNYGVCVKFFFQKQKAGAGSHKGLPWVAARSVGLTPLAKSPIATSFIPFLRGNILIEGMAMLECEVKFFIAHPAGLCDRLRRAGALPTGSAFETNFRYEHADNPLLARQCLLRLRRDRRIRLTYKQPDPSGGRQFKTYEELEIEVSDFDTTHQILEALGFQRAQIYEKHRETYELASLEICLDQLPFGHFIEIEGDAEMIPAMAARLGLAWPTRILANYLQIFETIREALQLPFNDVTFAAFETVQDDLTGLIRHFEIETTS